MSNSQTPNQEDFFPVAKTAEIQDGRITPITIHNTPIILTRIGQTIHAFSARCPHASGDLTQGDLHRGRIECPDHGYRFDIHSGFPVWPPDEVCRLKKYLTKEENGQLFVKI